MKGGMTCWALLAVALTLSSAPLIADEVYYRWMDERGSPVHSDRPPPVGVDYEVIRTGSSFKREVEADEGAVPLEVEPRAGNDFEQAQEEAKASRKNPEFCARAKDNLQQLQTRARIRQRNDQGEVYYLTEEDKAAERQKAMDAIEEFCE